MPEGHYTLICCQSCGNLYVDSDVTETYLDDLQGKFNPEIENKTTYEATAEDDKRRTLELAENWEMIARIRRPSQNDKLLDYGCAWGAFGNIAKKAGVIPNGVELQPAGAAHSLKLWGGESVVHRGPIETAPFGENEFQYITSFETLEHVFDPIRILKNIKRLLSADGVVAISLPSADYFIFKYWVYRKQPFNAWMRRKFPGNMQGDMVLIHNHINTFSLDAARVMMEKAGLRVIFISLYCSGLRGGRLGKMIKYIGKLIWLISFKKIILAPSIFIAADKKI
jgi:2-polyprenyl-3-methyl-5-hydroxy-6-metoxy-1,4-benzoquinol methylase